LGPGSKPAADLSVAQEHEGAKQPGRDHWQRANSMLFVGCGIATERVNGATAATRM